MNYSIKVSTGNYSKAIKGKGLKEMHKAGEKIIQEID